ncbi:MAG: zinc ABC transporter substrate-binding protein [Nitrospiraceae bacterium]|nr:MAG: zinc ABC transporter substrate-binding protein [Nitrospiraceae bacterium]
MFFEELVSPKLAETIARESGAETLVLNPLGGLTVKDREKGRTYISIMEDNLRNLRTAMDCK